MSSRLYPEGYAHWLARKMPETLNERLATCDNCAMVKPEGYTRDPGPFLANLKCCTYFPFIPNFGLGAILENALLEEINESSSAARLRFEAARSKGLLLPFGLFASPEHEARAKKAGRKGFGRNPELLCPFFDSASNGCSIWRNRPGVCATYFCKSERGEEGLSYWSEVESFLNHFEWTLATEVARRLGFGEELGEICEAVFLEESGPDRNLAVQGAWGNWHGRELDFFKRARESALRISYEELLGAENDLTRR